MSSTTLDTAHATAQHDTGQALGHVVPPSVLLATFGALIVLTLVTVMASTLGLGSWEIWVSLGIASIKGTLVAMYFMHLRYDKPFYALLAVFCLAFVMLLLGFTLLDSHAYQADIEAFTNRP